MFRGKLLLVFAGAISLYGQTKLTSGVPAQFLINTIYRVILNGGNGFVIPIPSGPIALEVKLELAPYTSSVNIYVRCGQDIGGANIDVPVYDENATTINGVATVVLNRPSGGADGNCYIATEPNATGNAGSTAGRVTATIRPIPTGTMVTVPSLGSIYLAGQPAGAKLGTLSVPSNSPAQASISINPGQGLNILAAGLITPQPQSVGIPPSGSGGSTSTAAAFGLSAAIVPPVSMVGVFVGDTVISTATPLGLAVGDDLTDVPLYPLLQQVFYIGNGVGFSGGNRVFVTPSGATRLFLASIAGGFVPSGSFTALISPAAIPSVAAPSTNPFLVSGLADLFLADQPNGVGIGQNASAKIALAATPYSVPPQVPITLTAGQNLHILSLEEVIQPFQSPGEGPPGLSDLPIVAGLTGVFVGDTIDPTKTPAHLNPNNPAPTLTPLLQQTFHIGNGFLSKTAVRNFTVPAGATRLLLANAGGGTAALGFTAASVTVDDPNAPVINTGGIVNNAGFPSGPVAAGSMVAIFGSNFGPQTFPSSLPLPTTLGGTQVFFNATPAPLVYVSPTQLVAQVPQEVYGLTSALVTPVTNGVAGLSTYVALAPFALGIFTAGNGDAVIIDNNTGQIVTPSAPASRGDVLIMYATGLGPTLLDPATGHPAAGASPALLPIRVTLKSSATGAVITPPLQYAGLAPGFVALYQINMQIPADAPTGTVIVAVYAPSLTVANPVTIGIK